MNVTLLGTGCPAVDTVRYGPAQIICHDDQVVLVDCGSGVSQRLLAAGVPGRDVDAVLFTHLHSDHIVDLFQLVISSWHQGRDQPQRIFGPPGTRRYVDALTALWRRHAYSGKVAWSEFQARISCRKFVDLLPPKVRAFFYTAQSRKSWDGLQRCCKTVLWD